MKWLWNRFDLWFTVATELGEITSPVIGISNGNRQIDWHRIPHEEIDGIGALVKIAADRGIDLCSLIEIKKKKIQWLKVLRCLPQYLDDAKVRIQSFKNRDISKKAEELNVEWVLIDKKELGRLSSLVKKAQISMTTKLVFSIDKVIRESLVEKDGARYWMVPANLRGYITRSKFESNHSSYLSLKLCDGISLRGVQEQITTQVNSLLHLATFVFNALATLLGLGFMRRTTLNYYNRGHCWMGSISNVGRFSILERPNEFWIMTPPVSKTLPIAFGVITINNVMTISCQIHPSLVGAHEQSKIFLEKIKSCLLEDC